LEDACAAKTANNFSGRVHKATSLLVGATVYYGSNSTDCILVQTGYYLTNVFPYQVVYIVDGVIDSFPGCP